MVLEVSRHGAREPSENFPFAKDPSQNYISTANLTWYGKKQQFDLGTILKEKYIT
jgi:hypothetical protein